MIQNLNTLYGRWVRTHYKRRYCPGVTPLGFTSIIVQYNLQRP